MIVAKTIGRFWYRILAPNKDGYPFNPIVHIVPKVHTQDAKGKILLSPNLMTEGEIDYHIQAYKDDLDHVGRLAKEALRRANKRQQERFREAR